MGNASWSAWQYWVGRLRGPTGQLVYWRSPLYAVALVLGMAMAAVLAVANLADAGAGSPGLVVLRRVVFAADPALLQARLISYSRAMNGQDEHAMVRRHIREGEVHIARQAEIVAKFSGAGHDTDMAETLLAQFRSVQALHCAHLARLVARPA